MPLGMSLKYRLNIQFRKKMHVASQQTALLCVNLHF